MISWDNRCTMHRGTEFDDLRWKRDVRYGFRHCKFLRAKSYRDRGGVRKISLARVTRILHKSVFITFAPGRRFAPLPDPLLLAASVARPERCGSPALRTAVSWDFSCYLLLPPCYFFAVVCWGWPKPVARVYRLGLQRWS